MAQGKVKRVRATRINHREEKLQVKKKNIPFPGFQVSVFKFCGNGTRTFKCKYFHVCNATDCPHQGVCSRISVSHVQMYWIPDPTG